MSVRCGIDLGTTYSAISYYDADNQRVEIVDLEHADGEQIIPSIVYFEPGGNIVVGEAARNAALAHPERVVIGIKRSMGDDYKTPPIDGKEYTPQEVSAEILKVLKADAERYLNEPVTDAVVSVPAYFEDQQRMATQEAAELAGFNVLDLISEPHAAALAFAIDRIKEVENRNIIVYDLGGGTFDVTLIITEGERLDSDITGLRVKTLVKDGNRHLGGLDWDQELARLVADKAMDEHSIPDPHLEAVAEAMLLQHCEKAKRHLSWVTSLLVLADLRGHQVKVLRNEFERQTRDRVLQTETLLERVLEEAEQSHGLLTEKRIQELEAEGTLRAELEDKKVRLLLCGGATRMPMVEDCVTRVMGEPPLHHKNPDLLVTVGAAYHAYLVGTMTDRKPVEEKPTITLLTTDQERPAVEPTMEQQESTPTTVQKQLTVAHVIDMFAGLNLPVTDNGERIAAKGKELSAYYLRMSNSPDPQQSHRAKVWFANLMRLQTDRDELIEIVQKHFNQLADTALGVALKSGNRELVPEVYGQLQLFAQEQCRSDPLLAQSFTEEYLQEKELEIRETMPSDSQEPPAAEDMIRTLRGINLLPVHGLELDPRLPREMARLKVIQFAQEMLSIAEILKEDMTLKVKIGEMVVKVRVGSDGSKMQQHTRRETRPGQPSTPPQSVKELLKALSSAKERCYDQSRIKKFLTNRVNLPGFCFGLKEVNPNYVYIQLAGDTPEKKSADLVQKADSHGKLGKVVLCLVRYWIETEKGSPTVLTDAGLHWDLDIFLLKLKEQKSEEDAKQAWALLEHIL